MRYHILILEIFLLPTILLSQTKEINAYLKEADRLIIEQNYSEALEYVELALEIDPMYIESLEKKVAIALATNDSKEILKEVEEWIKVSPQQPEYYYILSILHLYREKPQKALDDLDKAVYYQLPEKYMDKIYLNRGKAYTEIAEFDKAEEDFKLAIELNPKYSAVYHSYGMLKYELKRYEEAKDLFLKAIQYETNNALIYYNIAMSYLRLDEMKNACYYFNKACSMNYRNACKVYMLECSE